MGLGNFPLRKLPPGKFPLENSQKEKSHLGKLPLGKAPCKPYFSLSANVVGDKYQDVADGLLCALVKILNPMLPLFGHICPFYLKILVQIWAKLKVHYSSDYFAHI